jgi:hypothetical protein
MEKVKPHTELGIEVPASLKPTSHESENQIFALDRPRGCRFVFDLRFAACSSMAFVTDQRG